MTKAMIRHSQRTSEVVALKKPSSPDNNHWQSLINDVAKEKNRQSFSQLFRHFSPKLKAFALANPYSHNPQQFADDLIQEVMIKIWNKAGNYDPSVANVSTWIFTVARNCRIDMIRRNNRHNYPLDSDELLEIEDEQNPMPYQAAQQKQTEHELSNCFKQLPNDQVQIIAKVYLEGKSHTEVAAELDIPLGTVKSRVRLALNKLRIMVSH